MTILAAGLGVLAGRAVGWLFGLWVLSIAGRRLWRRVTADE